MAQKVSRDRAAPRILVADVFMVDSSWIVSSYRGRKFGYATVTREIVTVRRGQRGIVKTWLSGRGRLGAKLFCPLGRDKWDLSSFGVRLRFVRENYECGVILGVVDWIDDRRMLRAHSGMPVPKSQGRVRG